MQACVCVRVRVVHVRVARHARKTRACRNANARTVQKHAHTRSSAAGDRLDLERAVLRDLREQLDDLDIVSQATFRTERGDGSVVSGLGALKFSSGGRKLIVIVDNRNCGSSAVHSKLANERQSPDRPPLRDLTPQA